MFFFFFLIKTLKLHFILIDQIINSTNKYITEKKLNGYLKKHHHVKVKRNGWIDSKLFSHTMVIIYYGVESAQHG